MQQWIWHKSTKNVLLMCDVLHTTVVGNNLNIDRIHCIIVHVLQLCAWRAIGLCFFFFSAGTVFSSFLISLNFFFFVLNFFFHYFNFILYYYCHVMCAARFIWSEYQGTEKTHGCAWSQFWLCVDANASEWARACLAYEYTCEKLGHKINRLTMYVWVAHSIKYIHESTINIGMKLGFHVFLRRFYAQSTQWKSK